MSKVITFSRVFPAYHPRKGQPTYFVEKIFRSLRFAGMPINDCDSSIFSDEAYYGCNPKYHTIRAGHRFKSGDKFSPRVWSNKPYNSPQIIIAPDIIVVKTYRFKMDEKGFYWLEDKIFDIDEVAMNDGLTRNDFDWWFKQPKGKSFDGQIICWNKDINY